MSDIYWTAKQIEIMYIISQKNDDGTYCSVYDIMKKLSYEVKRDSLAHGIKILIDAGYIEFMPKERRGNASVRPYTLTPKGLVSIV